MKFTCDKNVLLESLNVVCKATSQNSNLELLKGIKIEADENLCLTGTDLEISIQSMIEAQVLDKGSIVLDSRIFPEIIRKIPDGIMTFVSNENSVDILSKSMKFSIQGISSEGYPEVKKIEEGNKIKIHSKSLKDIIKKTIFATCINEARPVLSGAKVEVSGSLISMIALDGTRLAVKSEIIPETGLSGLEFIIPGRTLNELLKVLKDDETEVEIIILENNVMFKFENYVLTSRLLEGEFLDYTKTIPSDCRIKLKLNTKELTDTVERASIIINFDDPKKIPVIFDIKNSCINVDCFSKYGDFHEEIEIKESGEIKIGIRSKLLLDALKSIDDNEIIMELTSDLGPCVLKPVEGKAFLYMVLPVRLRG